MKIYSTIFLIILATILSIVLQFSYSELFMNTLYTVLGIMFSIGLGLVVTFNLGGIKNRNFIVGIRKNLKSVRTLYIANFTASTIFFIAESQLKSAHLNKLNLFENEKMQIIINFSTLTVFFLIYSIVYCIVNLIELQRLSESIFDETNS